ncbi:MAG: hypothetical protein NZM18_11455 [Thermoflexales bacterium]|nr:hypothetical protein [Thermoflexales bacterium]MDW8351046.1 hypothetical protein [Anaerolineae bacterium]
MTDLKRAIALYHDLLDDETAQASGALLEEGQQRHGLFFGTRPLCTVLRPRFLTHEQYRFLRRAIGALMPAFAKLHAIALQDAAFRAQFRLADWEERLVTMPPPYRASSPTARMDTFFVPEANELKFTEYNAETPAGAGYQDALGEIMLGLPIMRKFARRYEVHTLPGKHHVLHALNESYREWGGRERMRICILDWKDVPTYSEFVQFEQYFKAQGYACVIADPRECEYRDGKFYAQPAHDSGPPLQVNVIYKRVLITELIERCGADHPVVRAVNDRAVCMVNPFHCKILHRKTSFAVISDEANQERFTADERQAIERFIPWTRLVAERFTIYRGRRVDLLPLIAHNREQFVLKPADEYGGKGIVLGWTVTQDEWNRALHDALNRPTIVQERVTVPSEPYPSLADGRLQIAERMLDTNPYVWYGEYASSCLTRLSTAALLNVTAGGGSTVPTFVIEER